jgi:predicted ArsR family transcriptional regulator
VSASVTAPLGARRRSHWLDVVADPVRLQILRALSQVTDATASELAAQSPASYQTLRRHLEALETFGVIRARAGVSDGETSGRPAARFSLSPDLRESVRSATAASTSTTSPASSSSPVRR